MLFVTGGASLVLAPKALVGAEVLNYQVCFSQECYLAESAQTPELRARGLMYRESLDDKAAMLFIFETLRPHGIWMKNMRISLDILWLDKESRIVDFKENVPPCRQDPCAVYEPLKPALYVLELKAGTVFKAGLKVGDQMTLRTA